jgi:hypothetical protein
MRFCAVARNLRSIMSCEASTVRLISCAMVMGALLAGSATSCDWPGHKVDDESLKALGIGAALEPASDVTTCLPQTALMAAIAAWISSRSALPIPDELPQIAFASSKRMIAIRYQAVPGEAWVASVRPGSEPEFISLYDMRDRIIYLPETWSGSTPAEMSVLVHEMVHHMQNIPGSTYPCPEALEKVAYAAQAEWLATFGSDLETAFGIDPLTLLVRTNCPY